MTWRGNPKSLWSDTRPCPERLLWHPVVEDRCYRKWPDRVCKVRDEKEEIAWPGALTLGLCLACGCRGVAVINRHPNKVDVFSSKRAQLNE